jgi:UDP-N-acetylglucosamine 4,6-dehydratase
MNLQDKVVLVTGGTGSFGRKFTEIVLKKNRPKKLIIFSRDELKQFEMAQKFNDKCIRYFLGDVRDKDRLQRAFHGVDVVIHAAALKQVPAGEYNPFEVVKTNVIGAQNIVDVAIDQGVKKVIALSTDKAANPVNLYGATKLCSDKIFIAGNFYVGEAVTRFSVVRYGNVINSRGSVIPLFRKLRSTGKIPITDTRMTRFWITLEESVNFVLKCLDFMEGGEIFVPKCPSMNIMDLAEALAPGCEHEIIGIRPGEKLHEVLIPEDEAINTIEYDDYFRILPAFLKAMGKKFSMNGGKPVPEEFVYRSDKNDNWLTPSKMRKIVEKEYAEV